MMAVYGFVPALTAVLLPAVMVAAMLAAFSVGVWLSALNVAYRDVRYVVPFLVQAWLFVTPVAYPTTSIPENLRWLAGLNPMTWVVDFSRWALLGTTVSWGVVGALDRDHDASCWSAGCTTSDAWSTSSPMSSEIAIRAEGIGKRYRLGATQGVARYRSLREDVAGLASRRSREAAVLPPRSSGR